MVKQDWNRLTPLGRAVVMTLIVVSLGHFAAGAWQAAAHGFADLPIFLHRVAEFDASGELYPAADHPQGYDPAAAVYKFPPLFAVLLLPQVRADLGDRIYVLHWLVQLAFYIATLLLLYASLARPSRRGLALLLVVAGLNFVPFFETLWRLQLETPILFLCALALWFERRERPYLAGAALGVAAMLKIYPLFLLGWFMVRRSVRGLVGAALAMTLVGLLGWWVIGSAQNVLYFTVILPRMLQEVPVTTAESIALAKPLQTLLGLSPELAKRAAQAIALVVLSAAYLVLERRSRASGQVLDAELSLAIFVAAMLLFMPNAWTNYLLLLLLPLAVILARVCEGAADKTIWVPALLTLGYFLTLFFTPCGPAEASWPCAQTPRFMASFHWPRAFHDLFVALKVLVVPVVCVLWFGVARAATDARTERSN